MSSCRAVNKEVCFRITYNSQLLQGKSIGKLPKDKKLSQLAITDNVDFARRREHEQSSANDSINNHYIISFIQFLHLYTQCQLLLCDCLVLVISKLQLMQGIFSEYYSRVLRTVSEKFPDSSWLFRFSLTSNSIHERQSNLS